MRTKLLLLGITTLTLASCGGGSSSTAGPGTDLAVQTTPVRAHVNTTATGVINLKAVDGNVTLSSLTINGADSGLFKINQTDLASCQKAPIIKGKACNVRYTFTPTSSSQTRFTATAVANSNDNDPINAMLLTGSPNVQIAVLGTQYASTSSGGTQPGKVYWQTLTDNMTASGWHDVTPSAFASNASVETVAIGRDINTKRLTVLVVTDRNLYVQTGISPSSPSLSSTGWTQVSLASAFGTAGVTPTAVAFDPIHPGVVYASVDKKLYQSTDNGLTWSDSGFASPDARGFTDLLAVSSANAGGSSNMYGLTGAAGQTNAGALYRNGTTGVSGLSGAWDSPAISPAPFVEAKMMPVFDQAADASNSFGNSYFLFGFSGEDSPGARTSDQPLAYLYDTSKLAFTKLNLDLPTGTNIVDGIQMLPAGTPPGSGAAYACNLAVASAKVDSTNKASTTIQYYDVDQGVWSNITPNPSQNLEYESLYATSDGDATGSDNHLFTQSVMDNIQPNLAREHLLTAEQSPFTSIGAWQDITPGGAAVAISSRGFAVSRPYYNQCDTN